MSKKSSIYLAFQLLIITVLLLAFSSAICAAPLKNVPVSVTQPDGGILKCLASGDEFFNYLHDFGGNIIIQDPETGYYTYARLDDQGKIIASDQIATDGGYYYDFDLKYYDDLDDDLDDDDYYDLEEEIYSSLTAKVDGLRLEDIDFSLNPDLISEFPDPKDSPFQTPSPESLAGIGVTGPMVKGAMENIVVMICFSDENQTISSTAKNKIEAVYNGPTLSLNHYMKTISEGVFSLNSTLVGLNGNTLLMYRDSQPRKYYQPYHAATNPQGYQGGNEGADRTMREHTLLQNAVNAINGSALLAGKNLDIDGDGIIDSISFIISGNVDGWSSLLWPHKWALYTSNTRLNGKQVYEYSFTLYDYTFPATGSSDVSTICHESLHTFGLPDLYRYTNNGNPVGGWDIMSDNAPNPQFPNSHMRLRYTGWGKPLTEITANGRYTLSPIGSTSGTTAYAIATSNPNQFILLEFRSSNNPSGYDTLFAPGVDYTNYAGGLTITRINTAFSGNDNRTGGTNDEVYVYRSYESALNQGGGLFQIASLSANAGRTSYGNDVIAKGYDRMICLYDGTNTNYIISNVSAVGSTISFDVKLNNTVTGNTVTYNYSANGGTSATKTTATLAQGAAIDLTPTATKSGWTFVGWNTSQNATAGLTSLVMGTSNVTLYAIYKKTLTGTFIDYNGTAKSTRTVQVTIYNNANSGSIITPSQYTYTGWTARGWSTSTAANAAVTVASNTNYTISADTTLYGLYNRSLTLSYNPNGGSSTPPNQTGAQYANSYAISTFVNPGFTLAAAIARSGYTFSGWAQGSAGGTRYAAGSSITISANTTMYATWSTGTTYTVTYNFKENGGTSATIATAVVASGTGVDLTPVATKAGWEFVGWNTDKNATTRLTSLVMGTANLTLYAIYKKDLTGTFIDYNGAAKYTHIAKATIYNKATNGQIMAPSQYIYSNNGWTWEAKGWSTGTAANAAATHKAGTLYTISSDITCYGLYSRLLSLSFNPNGGTPSPATQIKPQYANSYDITALKGPDFTPPKTITRTGFTFGGWYQGNTLYDFNKPVSGNTVLDARWNQITYDIIFDSAGGSSVAPVTVNHGQQVPKPADPVREGYTFSGWLKGTTTYNFANAVTSSFTLKAKWTVTVCVVTFDSQGGTAKAAAKVNYGNKVARPTAPTRTGFVFNGWYLGNLPYDFNAPVTGNITLTARWGQITCEIIFDSAGGSGVAPVTVNYGQQVPKPADPVRTGYTFGGWLKGTTTYNFASSVTTSFTLKAKWTATVCTVTFDSQGGTAKAAAKVSYGNKVARPTAPTRTGFVFNGWYLGSTPYDFDTPVTGNITLTARWGQITCEIIFDSAGGSGVAPVIVNYGQQVPKPADPVRAGYTFAGWLKGTTTYNFASAVTTSFTLKAKWTVNVYTVTFDSAGGTAKAAAKVNHGSLVKKPTNPTRTGFIFDGWYLGSSSTPYDFNTPIIGNITLSARWLPK
ncbi:MAG: InlB B-repeat-containing protein [Clostridiales bacterium]|nr:InlB B-repeat-containing protein [Clostridiales bacterium]